MYEEINSKMYGKEKYKRFKKMDNDSTVFKMRKAIELSAIGCDYDIEPASESSRDKMIAEFVKDSLFKKMGKTWTDIVTEVFTFVGNGFSLFEVWFDKI